MAKQARTRSFLRRRPARLTALVLFLAFCPTATAAPHLGGNDATHIPRSTRRLVPRPAPAVMSERAIRVPGDAARLLDAAVAADPLVSADLRTRFHQEALQRLAEARSERTEEATEWEIARAAFSFLHARILTGRYEPRCARLQTTLADGTYNCLTATYWYLALCRDGGLRAEAVAAPSHVAVRLWLDGSIWDIETTDGRWSPQPGDSGANGRVLLDSALLGRVYYNLGIAFAQAGDYERALWTTRRSWQLDPHHAEARANLLATLNNWSVELSRQGDYGRAEALIREGLALDPGSEPLRRSDAYMRQQQAASR